MTITPITRNAAAAYLSRVHRHLRPPQGWLFGVALCGDGGEVLGVGCAGRPTARNLQDGATIEITRIATAGEPNGCSQLYGALRKAAVALGYRRVYTYTRADEPGTSPRAAGFIFDGAAGGGEATRPSRRRRASDDPGPKHRWVWPASAKTLQLTP